MLACPQCGNAMVVKRSSPHPARPDHTKQKLECTECGQSITRIVDLAGRTTGLSAFVKVFGCRLMTDGAANSAVGGRRSKTSKGGNRGNGYVRRFRGLYGDLAAARGAADGSRWD